MTAKGNSETSSAALLTDPVLPRLLRLTLPNMVAMLAAALAAIAETMYVGSLGPAALAGMALVFPFVMLQMMLSGGAIGGGVSAAVSRALGARDPERANALTIHGVWIGVLAGLAFMSIMLVFGAKIFSLLGGEGEALTQALAYSEVAFLASIFIWIVNTLSAAIRGAGGMAVPAVTLFLVAGAQVVLSGALGLGWFSFPQLGMRGIAMGGLIAYAVASAVLILYVASGRGLLRLRLGKFRLSPELFKDILRTGLVASISPLQTILTILILTRLVAFFGVEALAGYGIGTRLEFLLLPLGFAVGIASVPMVGMAIGAGNIERARSVAWTAALLALALLGGVGFFVAVYPQAWTHMFTQEPAIVAAAQVYFQWVGPTYGLFGLGLSLYFSSIAAGKAAGPVLAGTLRLMVVAAGGIALAYLAAPAWMIFALIALGMAVHGLSAVQFVRSTPWDPVAAR